MTTKDFEKKNPTLGIKICVITTRKNDTSMSVSTVGKIDNDEAIRLLRNLIKTLNAIEIIKKIQNSHEE